MKLLHFVQNHAERKNSLDIKITNRYIVQVVLYQLLTIMDSTIWPVDYTHHDVVDLDGLGTDCPRVMCIRRILPPWPRN